MEKISNGLFEQILRHQRSQRLNPTKYKHRHTTMATLEHTAKAVGSNQLTQANLAQQFGISEASLSKALSLLRLPWPVLRLICKGSISTTTAYHISRIKDRKSQIEIAHLADQLEMRSQDIKTLLNLLSFLPKPMRHFSLTTKDGVHVDVRSHKPISVNSIRRVLRNALKKHLADRNQQGVA